MKSFDAEPLIFADISDPAVASLAIQVADDTAAHIILNAKSSFNMTRAVNFLAKRRFALFICDVQRASQLMREVSVLLLNVPIK